MSIRSEPSGNAKADVVASSEGKNFHEQKGVKFTAVTDASGNKVDRALVWNGSTWGNQSQLDNTGQQNFTDANVAYE